MKDAEAIKELDALDTQDPEFLSKLQLITDKIAASRLKTKKAQDPNFVAPEDPQDLLNCDSCQ